MARTYSECVARHAHGARLVAVACGNRAPDLAADYEVDFVRTAEELVARTDVDAVIIATPEMVHLEQTALAGALIGAAAPELSEEEIATGLFLIVFDPGAFRPASSIGSGLIFLNNPHFDG